MKMVIAGGGKIGLNLARIMLEKRHIVSVIERNKERCEKLANALDAEIICGDCSSVSVLEAAGTQSCDCFMAVTGNDQDNLVASQLAKDYFKANKVIARSSDPRNLETFRLLGIENAVSSTEVITGLIEQEADLAHLHLLASLNKGKAGIVSATLPPDSAYHQVAVRDIKFPKGTLLISVVRNDEFMIPDGSTVLQSGDEVVIVCVDKNTKALTKLISAMR